MSGSPKQDHSARDGNAMTGYDQSVALDGDATNQARTVFGFDGNAMTGQGPQTAPEPSPKGPAPSGPKPERKPTPKLAPEPVLAPKPVKQLEPPKEPKNLERIPGARVEPRADAKPKRTFMPTPFKAPKPRPPR